MYNTNMEIIWQFVFIYKTLVFLVISKIQTIKIIAISFILGMVFARVIIFIIKCHTKRSPPDTEDEDTSRFSANTTTEPTYLNVNYRNQWDQKIPVQETPVYAEVGPGNDLLVGLPQGLASAPPRI